MDSAAINWYGLENDLKEAPLVDRYHLNFRDFRHEYSGTFRGSVIFLAIRMTQTPVKEMFQSFQ
jgi:hypothetical protein